jgi:hypothetical protein
MLEKKCLYCPRLAQSRVFCGIRNKNTILLPEKKTQWPGFIDYKSGIFLV